jgi:hypothetical protein
MFAIGDRVQLSQFGLDIGYRRRGSTVGTVVAVHCDGDRVTVLWDGNKSSSHSHFDVKHLQPAHSEPVPQLSP